MNIKIKVLAILLGAIYFIIVLHSICIGRNYFIGEPMSKIGFFKEYYYVDVEPKQGLFSFTEELNNVNTGEAITAETERFIMNIPAESLGLSAAATGIKGFLWILCATLAAMVLITPFPLSLDIYKASKKGITKSTLNTIRLVSWILSIYFILDLANILLESSIIKSHVELEQYNIVQPFPQYFILTLAIVLFILGEVVKESMKMKEEQELTI